MILVHTKTHSPLRVGSIVRNQDTGKYATVAGWDPATTWVHVWLNADQIGDMRYVTTYSAHFFGLEWAEDQA